MSLPKSLLVPALLSVFVSLILWSEFLHSGSLSAHSCSCDYIIRFYCCVVFLFCGCTTIGLPTWLLMGTFQRQAHKWSLLWIVTCKPFYEKHCGSSLRSHEANCANKDIHSRDYRLVVPRSLSFFSLSAQDWRVTAAPLLTRIGFQLPFPAHLLSVTPPSFLVVLVFQMYYLFGEI